jgi:PAS domain S-box-containing protein
MGVPLVGLFGELERRLVDVLDRVSDSIVALDRDWRLVYVNQAAQKHFGVPREQLLGTIFWELFPETVGSPIGEQYRRAAAEMTPVEFETISPITKRTVAQRVYPSGSGLTVYLRDVSDERQTAEARKRGERAMSLIADAGEELSLSLERDEIIRRLSALIVPSIADVCIVDLLVDESLTRAAVRQREGLASGAFTDVGPGRVIQTASSEVLSSVRDDAEGLAALGVRSAVRVPLLVRGKPTGVLSLLIADDSRRFVADDLPTVEALADRVALALENARLYELAVSAKRARDEMMSMVSHDLRNSLNAIGFIATELARQNGSPLATQIRSAATLADRLLADLGAMFVIESGALVLGRVMESIDSIMNEVADLFRPLAEARAVRLRAVIEKKGLTAFVDRYRMVQAVSNVVANAVEISQDGGQVELAVKQVGDQVEVAVSDTGPGLAPDEIDQIFDRHRWGNDGRRRASVGLGLVISKEYVEAHGGRIRVQNRPGSGSTFIIAIPISPRGLPGEMPPPSAARPARPGPARPGRRAG